MIIEMYGIPNCNSVKKAKDWLQNEQIEFRFHDYKKEGVTADQLKDWVQQLDLNKIVNKQGTTYKKLSDDVKSKMEDVSFAINQLIQQPSMIKRPLLLNEKRVLTIGFDAEVYTQLLK